MGSSPLHASTVGLIRSLRTNHISPQFHVVYDDLFETVHSSALEVPDSWPDLFTFNQFRSNFDDENFVPDLTDEWLTPVELSRRQQVEQTQRSQDGAPSTDDQLIRILMTNCSLRGCLPCNQMLLRGRLSSRIPL
jgi:hypothetical protein